MWRLFSGAINVAQRLFVREPPCYALIVNRLLGAAASPPYLRSAILFCSGVWTLKRMWRRSPHKEGGGGMEEAGGGERVRYQQQRQIVMCCGRAEASVCRAWASQQSRSAGSVVLKQSGALQAFGYWPPVISPVGWSQPDLHADSVWSCWKWSTWDICNSHSWFFSLIIVT